MASERFTYFQKRVNALEEKTRATALAYAEEFYLKEQLSKEQALEKAIAKAELEKRNL